MDNTINLNVRQDRAITAILNSKTIKEAAIQIDVSERSLYRWLQDEGFKFELRQARREILRQATTRLQQIAGEAVETLHNVMKEHEKTTAASRVSAARTALDYAYRAVELEDLDERVATLEQTNQQHH